MSQQLTAFSHGFVKSAGFDRTLTHELYDALAGTPQIAVVVDSKSHWIFVAQGSLVSLQFPTLIARAVSGGAQGDTDLDILRTTSWLVTIQVITLLPSVSSIGIRTRNKPTALSSTTASFGLGAPYFIRRPERRSC